MKKGRGKNSKKIPQNAYQKIPIRKTHAEIKNKSKRIRIMNFLIISIFDFDFLGFIFGFFSAQCLKLIDDAQREVTSAGRRGITDKGGGDEYREKATTSRLQSSVMRGRGSDAKTVRRTIWREIKYRRSPGEDQSERAGEEAGGLLGASRREVIAPPPLSGVASTASSSFSSFCLSSS